MGGLNIPIIRLTMNEKEELISSLPDDGSFSVKDLKKKLSKGFQNKHLGPTLKALEDRGIVRRAGTTGRLGRYILWQKIVLKGK